MKPSLAISLGANLKKLLVEKDISLHQLSRKTNINKSTLHNYLNGVHPQGLDALLKLTDFFQLSLEQLLFTEDELRALSPKKPTLAFTEGHFEITIKKVE